MYLEDQLKPAQNLTVTLGLRFDREEIDSAGYVPFDPRQEQADYFEMIESGAASPRVAFTRSFTALERTADLTAQLALLLGIPTQEVAGLITPAQQQSEFWTKTRRLGDLSLRNDNFSPYIGLAWDPWSDGKTKFAFAASRHYNNIPLSVPLVELEPVETDVTFRAFPGTRFFSRPYGGINLGLSTQLVDRDIQTPYQDELFLTAEREIFAETSLRLSYIKRLYRDQLQDIDINRFTGDFGVCQTATPADRDPIRATGPTEYPDDWPGDGVIDDCVGRAVAVGDGSGGVSFLQRPDGFADLYLANPVWVDVLLLGNFNSADYDGVTLELIRRFYRSWEMLASYTWSKTIGDGEDFLQQLGNDNALAEDERGFQSDDRRHVVKVNGAAVTPGGFRLGAALSWRSGLPFSILTESLAFDTLPLPYGSSGGVGQARPRQLYVEGQRNTERNVDYWNLDLKLSKEFNVARRVNVRVSAEIFNVLDDQTYIVYNPALGLGRRLNGEDEAFRRQGRSWQLGLRLAF
jgi:hypothetical protein